MLSKYSSAITPALRDRPMVGSPECPCLVDLSSTYLPVCMVRVQPSAMIARVIVWKAYLFRIEGENQ